MVARIDGNSTGRPVNTRLQPIRRVLIARLRVFRRRLPNMASRSPITATGRRLHRTHRTNLPTSVRHTAESGAVALACLQLEREPCEPACRVSQRIEQPIARSHSPH